MKNILITVLLLLILQGCKTRTVYIPVKQSTHETVTLRDTVIDTRLEFYRDTIVTPDSISFLSNPYGFSWAEAKGGRLHHSLSVWPDSLIPIKTVFIDKVVRDSIPCPYPVEIEVPVEKKLSIWQYIRIRLGEILLIGLIIIVVWSKGKRFFK